MLLRELLQLLLPFGLVVVQLLLQGVNLLLQEVNLHASLFMLLLFVLRHWRSSVFHDLLRHDRGRLGAHLLTHSFLARRCFLCCCCLCILDNRFLCSDLFYFFSRFGRDRSLCFLGICLRLSLLFMLLISFLLLLCCLLLLFLIC